MSKIIAISLFKSNIKSSWFLIVAIAISLLSFSIVSAQQVQPSDFEYIGAFRLPGDVIRPKTFAYGGDAMTYNPDGDPSGPADGFSGSLFIMGHDRIAYGEVPDGNQVAEVNIPIPVISGNPSGLPQAAFLQDFQNVLQGQFSAYEELPQAGLLYLNNPATGPIIHVNFGQHFQDPPADIATHGWFSPTLSTPGFTGTWYIGNQSLYSVSAYLFEIPSAWADANTGGRYIGTGRYRGGGWSGQGPAIFAYVPWTDSSGTPAPSGTHLVERTLLLYASSLYTDDVVTHSLNGYQHADEWEGGAWITTPSGKSAMLFAGTKGTGTRYWYGYVNPGGPEFPCVDAEVTDFVTCRMANGTSCPPEDFAGCCSESAGTCISYRGWWSTRFDAQFILYDTADLAQVAAGTMESWEPQPYASLDIDEHLFLNPSGIDIINYGSGDQRRFRILDVTFDRSNSLLYVLEEAADGAKPVVHVWRINDGVPTSVTITTTSLPNGTVGTVYSQTVQATGGPSPYTWTVSTGSLPDNLTINGSTGVISGTPTVAATFNFTVQVTDTAPETDTQDLSIVVEGPIITPGFTLKKGKLKVRIDDTDNKDSMYIMLKDVEQLENAGQELQNGGSFSLDIGTEGDTGSAYSETIPGSSFTGTSKLTAIDSNNVKYMIFPSKQKIKIKGKKFTFDTNTLTEQVELTITIGTRQYTVTTMWIRKANSKVAKFKIKNFKI